MTLSDANRCRFVPGSRAGHYESYFLRANEAGRARAFWIRYTFFSPAGQPQQAVGEVWAVFFDGERRRIVAVKNQFALGDCTIGTGAPDLLIGQSQLGASCLMGSAATPAHRITWALGYDTPQPPLLLMPAAMYAGRFPQSKVLVGAPGALFAGELEVDGETVAVQQWRGSQNHNWGSRHTDTYCWGQVAGFDDAPDVFLECSTARLKFGPLWSPQMSLVVLRIGALEFSLNSITQALRTRARIDGFGWDIDARAAGVRVQIRIEAPRAAFAGLHYPNPPGGVKTCLNSKLASCALSVTLPGQAPRTFNSHHGAAFEILTDRADHGVAILA
ncbi:hypothetical protein [Massilia antarctica]|uniref:hypothetical protein n=1 Tax=Massilia antarctica TaxID=2765360 RepID=UPI0006BB961A|nr:hypothetical protein [Massilia sp. H27-R4]MCY0915387.1 hypothetical protein [Massilia sp. H27-R4]CUI05849.1 hypothetical protein BN2497_6475 [Janthinobacterium sp. CG23_2]CUU29635.1 hypothetical protein BN3177_6475 [Janthinobacterium sp. CG23_2]